jgi:hypothetical protein
MGVVRLLACALAGALAGCAYSYSATGSGTLVQRSSPLMLWEDAWRAPPRMSATRTVNEQDCTQPNAAPGANLKCR